MPDRLVASSHFKFSIFPYSRNVRNNVYLEKCIGNKENLDYIDFRDKGNGVYEKRITVNRVFVGPILTLGMRAARAPKNKFQ